jgi:4-hydroxy-3-polyprenylbenzoate decarboxylase
MESVSRVVVGVSGASGAVLAVHVLELLSQSPSIETHLVISNAARQTLNHEVGPLAVSSLLAMSDCSYEIDAIGAEIASGSFPVSGMIVAPCSMRTLSAIACGNTDNLLTRAADVQLKERRKLVLLARETPVHLVHLKNMVSVTEMGAIVMPPVPGFYQKPQTVAEIVHHIAARAIDLLRLPIRQFARPWDGGAPEEGRAGSPEARVFKIGVLTVSDRASRGEYKDVSGPCIEKWIRDAVVSEVEIERRVVSDGVHSVAAALVELADIRGCDLVFTTGGTGPSPRDLTREAMSRVIEKELPGFGEHLRRCGLDQTPTSILSRQTAGVRGKTLIVNLPGKPRSIDVGLVAIFGAVPYCLELIGAGRLETKPHIAEAYRP